MTQKKQPFGFTLIEMSIVLLVLSLSLGTVIGLYNQQLRIEKNAITQTKMDAIEKALYNFRVKNGRLPCPGSPILTMDSSNFGRGQGSVSSCSAPGATRSTSIYDGDVPVRDIGLDDSFAFDGWGRKFLYAVDNGADFSSGTDTANASGNLYVRDANAADIASPSEIFAVILSFGLNGDGGYSASGEQMSAGSTNTMERNNNNFTSTSTFYQARFAGSSTDSRDEFDDIVRFYPLSFFYTYAEKNP